MVAENLHRSELSVQERSDHIAEWIKLTEEMKVAQLAPPGHRQPRERRRSKCFSAGRWARFLARYSQSDAAAQHGARQCQNSRSSSPLNRFSKKK
jgi:hypothetical protein